MKTILCVVLALVCELAFASGRVTLKPVVNAETKEQTYTLSLSVYEPLLAGISYVGYLGVGEKLEQMNGNWVRSEQGFEMSVLKASIGLGVSYKYVPLPEYDQLGYYGTVSLTLW